MTNFERATYRMRAQGYRPFTPYEIDVTPRWLPQPLDTGAREPAALRIDVIIAVFAAGIALGMLIA